MKILILTASPLRDKIVDEQLADELTKLGNEVWVKACLREGRDAILALRPDVVVTPPIRNPYARDFSETCKRFGCGVISRHTEASCDWQDWKKLNDWWKNEILGRWSYDIDLEIVWGEDEAQILRRRPRSPKVEAVGSFVMDIYKKKGLKDKFLTKEAFIQKFKFDPKKKTLLVSSPWGFADSAPDLQIPEISEFNKDKWWQDIQITMLTKLKKDLSNKWNIMLTLHPGVVTEPYKKICKKLGIPLDTESRAIDLLKNADLLVHAGSTMAMEMHAMNKPALQFGDINNKHPKNWWLESGSPMSQLSPVYKDVDKLIVAIKRIKIQSNINKKVLAALEIGRYGKMDGKATKRAAKLINEVKGKFKDIWPKSTYDYNLPHCIKNIETAFKKQYCGVCKEWFYIADNNWLATLAKVMGAKKGPLPDGYNCPHCASRLFVKQ